MAPETADADRAQQPADQRDDAAPAAPAPAASVLPYAPWLQRLLTPLRQGFLVTNRWVTEPIYRAGLGPLLSNPLTGSILVLRTTGRKTGLVREAPLGYAIVDGRVVVVAGYGRDCHWFRNALAHPHVEIALPGAVLAGHAEEITDPEQQRRAFRAVATSMGAVGRVTLGDIAAADDARIDELVAGFPLLAVTPTEVLPGPYDPDGHFWRIPLGATLLGATLVAAAWRRAHGTSRPG
jgi:deazaflavin-dependent oxidoreductase (nitroreductase family)